MKSLIKRLKMISQIDRYDRGEYFIQYRAWFMNSICGICEII